MKYDINLYSDELRPKKQLFNLAFCLIIVTIVVASVIAVGSGYDQELQVNQQTIDAKNNQIKILRNELKALKDGQVVIKQDAQKLAAHDTLSKKLAFYQQLNKELKGQASQTQQSFSTLMLVLAEYHEPTIALSSIRVEDDRLRFEGTTESSSSVPTWLSSLSQSPWFSAREFSKTRIYRNKDGQLQFIIGASLGEIENQAQGY